jgi:hypothetical protein
MLLIKEMSRRTRVLSPPTYGRSGFSALASSRVPEFNLEPGIRSSLIAEEKQLFNSVTQGKPFIWTPVTRRLILKTHKNMYTLPMSKNFVGIPFTVYKSAVNSNARMKAHAKSKRNTKKRSSSNSTRMNRS